MNFARNIPLLALLSCAAPLGRDAIEGTVELDAQLLRPRTLDASAPSWPTWLRQAGHGRPSENGFVGQAESPTMEGARALAMRDLYAAVSSYLSIEVSSELDDRMVEANGASSQTIREVVRSRSSAELQGITADAAYWEQVLVSPLAPESARYRYYVRARLDRTAIEQARSRQARGRQARTARRTVAILPFEAALQVDARSKLLARGLSEDLAVALAAQGDLYVSDPQAVAAVLEAEGLDPDRRLERVREALAPDVLVTGLVQRDGPRLRATLVLHPGAEASPPSTRSLERRYSALPELSGQLAQLLVSDLQDPRAGAPTAPAPASPAAPAPAPASSAEALEALEAYHGALAAFQLGDNDRALTLIHRSLALQPDNGLAYLRLGRILERLGRYGKLPPSSAVLEQRAEDVVTCTLEGREAVARAEARLKARAAALRAGGSSVTDQAPLYLDVDLALPEVLNRPIDFHFTPPPIGEVWARATACTPSVDCPMSTRGAALIDSALEAYIAARLAFEAGGGPRHLAEVDLAIGDLARRVDRLNEAFAFYSKVSSWAEQTSNLDLVSQALVGRAAVLRSLGNLEAARQELELALQQRAILGEKPQLLELHNELAGVLVELGLLEAAEQHFRGAWRLATELGNEYLQAVLQNNIGVLELRQGRRSAAQQHVEQAAQYLANVGELEGRAASSLNLGLLAAIAGDPEAASEAYDRAGRLIERSKQEAWLGQVAAKRGALWAAQGEARSLEELGLAYLVFRGLRRSVQAERLANNLLVAELDSSTQDQALLDCLKARYWTLGAPAFWMKKADPRTPTLRDLPPAALQDQELITALNAASLGGLSAWAPEQLRVTQRPPPPWPQPLLESQRRRPPPGPGDRPQNLGVDRLPQPRPQEPPIRPEQDLPLPPIRVPAETLSIAGTAAAGRTGGPEPPATIEPTVVTKAAAHERILGTFTADADLYVLLDPQILGAHYHPQAAAWTVAMLAGALRMAEAKGAAPARAVALLNLGAYEWRGGRAETAYALMMSAHQAFAESGERAGLAHSYEWLGYFFLASGDQERAAQNLGLAHQLYLKLGHGAAAERVLSYGR